MWGRRRADWGGGRGGVSRHRYGMEEAGRRVGVGERQWWEDALGCVIACRGRHWEYEGRWGRGAWGFCVEGIFEKIRLHNPILYV